MLVDPKWFGRLPPKEWKNYTYSTTKNFADFLNLSDISLFQRKIFIKDLICNKELSLTDGLVVLRSKLLTPTNDPQGGRKKDRQSTVAGAKQSPKKEPDLICDFYNRDGTTAEMCGNAACCISDYMAGRGFFYFSFLLGRETVAMAKNDKGKWGISLTGNPFPKGDFPFEFKGERYAYTLISSGVPHAVIECPLGGKVLDLQNPGELRPLAKKLRFQNPKSNQG